jgi:alcohol dehydrogenase
MFTFGLITKIVFGGPVETVLPAELSSLGVDRILLVSDPGLEKTGLVEQIRTALKKAGAATSVFTQVTSNPTTNEVAKGLVLAQAEKVRGLVALGGGSPIDVAKGIAMLLANGGTYRDYQWGGKGITRRSYPLIAIPTTAGTGSEVSKVAVISDPENPFKKGVLSPLMFPHVAIADPELTRGLPPKLTAATGMDAFIHALESFVGLRANPFSDLFAQAAMQTVKQYLPRAVVDGEDMEAREKMMLAALWGGITMDQAGLGLVHALSGPLCSFGHLHHGTANALILPYVLRYNAPAISPARQQFIQELFDLKTEQDPDGLFTAVKRFVKDLGLPITFDETGLSLDSKTGDSLAAETMRMVLIQNNPRPTTKSDCLELLHQMA